MSFHRNTTDKGDTYVTSHGKAPSTGQTQRQAPGLGRIFRGAFATRGASSGAYGSGAPSRALSLPLSAGLVIALLCAFTASASADSRIGEARAFPFSSQAGGIAPAGGIAVSEGDEGNVYFPNGGLLQRIDQLHPDGTWGRAFGFGIVPGETTGFGNVLAGSSAITNVTTTRGAFSQSGLGGKIITGPGIPPETTIITIKSNGELVLSKQASASGTHVPLSVAAGPGNIPTNEQQQAAVAATGGTFSLTFISPRPDTTSETTSAISFDASAGAVQATLEALPNIGAGNVLVSGGPGNEEGTNPYVIEFKGRFADTNVRVLSSENISLSGGNPSSGVTITTPQEGGGVPEICTTDCVFASGEETAVEFGEGVTGSRPGQLDYNDEIAVDNNSGSGSYEDVYVVDQRNFRIDKYDSEGHWLLEFGGEVDKGPHHPGDVCTAEYIAEGDNCGAGVPGTGPSHFSDGPYPRSFGDEGNNSIAVGPGGRVYVGDYGRVQEFSPMGAFLGELSLPDGGDPKFVSALAVDSAGNIFERSTTSDGSGGFLDEIPGVREFDSSHTFIRSIDAGSGSEPTHIAVNTAGDLFVIDKNGGERQFRTFKPNGALSAVFTSSEVKFGAFGLALDSSAERVYVPTQDESHTYIAVMPFPVYGAPAITEEHVDNVEPTTATLHGIVNPSGFDTHFHFQYVDEASFQSEGGFSSPHTQSTSSKDLGSINRLDPVQEAVSGLEPGTVYHFRIVAENSEGIENGADETFESLTPFSVRNLTTQTVGPELVILKGEINPNGAATNYTVHIGTDTNYSGGAQQGSLPVGNEFVSRTFTFTGLKSNTEYHYQIVGENSYGEYATSDQTVTTEPSADEARAAEECPNTNRREENNSLSLPDCRSYEQVSAVQKEGGQAFPGEALAPSGERALYLANAAFAGAQSDELAVYYIAKRSSEGWTSLPVIGRPAGLGYQPGGNLDFSSEMDRWIFGEQKGLAFQHPDLTSLFYSMGLSDGTFVNQVTPTFSAVEGGQVQAQVYGQSSDLSRLFILTPKRLLQSDPRKDSSTYGAFVQEYGERIYEVSGVGGPNPTMKLVVETPLGLAGPTCGASDFLVGLETYGRSKQMVSANGSTLVYTVPFEVSPSAKCGTGTIFEGRPNQFGLFAKVGEAAPVQVNVALPSQCSSPSPCAAGTAQTPLYDGVSADGTRVWFTTSQPLVDEDTDQTNDLYMAVLEPTGQLKELVLASAGNVTPSHPTPGQGADLGEEGMNNVTTPDSTNQGVVRISSDGTHAAFESAAVLTTEPNGLDQTPIQHANNIYTYDALTGETKFVTDVCSGPELTGTDRPDRSIDGLTYEVTPEFAVHDAACPKEPYIGPFVNYNGPQSGNDTELWFGNNASGEATFSANGRYLFFTSYGRLTPDDNDNVKDLFRFDTQTGSLIRLSFGRNGNDANGNDENPVQFEIGLGGTGGRDAAGDGERKISADGSIAIFETVSPLVSHDTNGGSEASCEGGVHGTGCDVYMWEESGHGTCTEAGGCVSLVSDGVAPHGAHSGVISSSGNDITFQTQRSEVPGDTDVVGDIYDARVNGGFHAIHPPIHCIGGEPCRAPQEANPSPPTIGSETFVGPGNAQSHLKCAKGRRRVIRNGQPRCVKKHHKKTHRHKKGHKRSPRRAAHTNRGGAK